MEDRVINTLKQLRAYALERGLQASIGYHEEFSNLMRFANSAISLNTSEHLTRLFIKVFDGNRRAETSIITDPEDLESMRKAIDTAADLLQHAEALSYTPTIPEYKVDVVDTRAFCPSLSRLSNEDRLAYFNTAAAGLETNDHKLSGNFSSGITYTAQISTPTEHTQFFASTDAQITVVISSESLKWEVNGERSAQRKSFLKPEELNQDLAFIAGHYSSSPAVRLPVGKYNVVLGPAATADLLSYMGYAALQGGAFKRNYSFLKAEDIGQRVLSDQFTLLDDPRESELFAQSHDIYGIERQPFYSFRNGVFEGFFWEQDDADEFAEQPTGHSVYHTSMVMDGGSEDVADLQALAAMAKEADLLYIPYLHYMNIVNPTKGLVTGSSRFGALMFWQDGRVEVPYNVRLTQAFGDFFGDKLAWMSRQQVVYNASSNYAERNPVAMRVPRFVCVRGLEISHSNSSY